jgi:hypothetical protein
MTTSGYDSIRLSEDVNGLTISYARSDRLELAALFTLAAAIVIWASSFFFADRPTLFSWNWWLIPICLFGYAALLLFLFRSGMFKSPLHINQDGSVRQGIWTWQFPGPMRAMSTKVEGKVPHYVVELRYGATKIRYQGGDTEGSTIGVVIRANRWIESRVHGRPDTSSRDKKISGDGWLLRACMVFGLCMPFCEMIGGDGYYLDGQAPYGTWAFKAVLLFAALAIGALGVRLSQILANEIKVGSTVWLTEICIASLVMLGLSAAVGHYAQLFEMRETPGVLSIVDQPLNLTDTTSGKGCHRYLILYEPSLKQSVQYCDWQDLRYWDGATGVRVRQSGNAFGLRIESVERISAP